MTLEIREFEVREVNPETRTISGLAVPYDTPTPVGDYNEQIARGAFGELNKLPLFYGHNHRNGGKPIGTVTAFRDTNEGLEVDAVLSDKTVEANEVYGLLKDGVLDRFSIGFEPVEQKVDGNTVVRTKATLREISVVPMPAYAAAKVSNVRDDEGSKTENNKEVMNNMTEEVTSEAVAEIREAVTDLERKFAGFTPAEAVKEGSQFRTAGEALKALATGDEKAKMEFRYTGATSADTHASNDWHSSLLTIVNYGRPLLNLFSRSPLGATGNTVEYPKISALTGAVASQGAQGNNLAYLEVDIDSATAPVITYGGYSELTRQSIERSDVPYLQKVLEYQAASYAASTNGVVVTALGAATPQTGTSFTLSSATAASFIGAVVDGRSKIKANGRGARAQFVLVSSDVWLKMATLVDSAGRPVFDLNGDGTNTVGNVNVSDAVGRLVGLPIVLDENLAVKTMYVAAPEAITTWENAGAPVSLNDENIINLSKQFSLYGYMAVGATNENGLVKPTIA